jgi:hypothetical protein
VPFLSINRHGQSLVLDVVGYQADGALDPGCVFTQTVREVVDPFRFEPREQCSADGGVLAVDVREERGCLIAVGEIRSGGGVPPLRAVRVANGLSLEDAAARAGL